MKGSIAANEGSSGIAFRRLTTTVSAVAIVAVIALAVEAGAGALPGMNFGRLSFGDLTFSTVHADITALDSAGRSEIHALNLGSAAAAARLRFVAPGADEGLEHPLGPIDPLISAALALSDVPGLEAESRFGVTADGGRFALTARTRWDDSGSASVYGAPPAGTALVVPYAAKFHRGRSTYVTIQNADTDAPASVRIIPIKSLATTPSMTGTLEIQAGGSAGFWLGEGPTEDLRDGWFGTLWIESDRPVSAVALISDESGGPAVFESIGFRVEDAAPEWHIPRFRAQRAVDDALGGVGVSRIVVANPSRRIAVLVTAHLRGETGACAGETFVSGTKTIRAGSNLVFHFGPTPDRDDYVVDVPEDCEGTVRFQTSFGTTLVWATEERWSPDGSELMAAGAFAPRSSTAAAHREIAPIAWDGSTGVGEIRSMNLGQAPAEVRLTLRGEGIDPGACGAPCRAIVQPGASHVWMRSDLAGLPEVGNASVEVSADEPVMLLVEDLPFASVADFSLYSGVPLPDVDLVDHGRLPIALNGAQLPPPARDPTPTPTNTWTPFPTGVDPYPRPGTPTITPTLIPSRTPTPIPTEVPTEVPLGEVWLQSLDSTGPVEGELALIKGDGSTSASVLTRPLGYGAAERIDLEPLSAVLGGAIHGGVARRGGGLGALASLHARRGAAVAYSPPETGAQVIVPLALIDYRGRSSSFAVQNASSDRSVEVIIELIPSGRSTYTRRVPPFSLAPGASRAYRLGIDTEFVAVPAPPEGFRGWMRVSADGPVSVVSIIEELTSARTVHTLSGVPAGSASTRHVAPAVHATDALSSTIVLFNPGPEEVETTIRYQGIAAPCSEEQFEVDGVRIAPYSSVDAGPASGEGVLPAGCVANAVISSEAPIIVAVVGWAADPTDVDRAAGAFGYPAVPDGEIGSGSRLALPRLKLRADGVSSRIAIMNAGTAADMFQLMMFDSSGVMIDACGGPCEVALGPGEGHLWELSELPRVPDAFVGSGLIAAEVAMAAVVIDHPEAAGKDLSAYLGQRLDRVSPPRHLPMLNFAIKPGFVTGPTPTASPWPTSTPRPTSYPGTGASDLIAMQNMSDVFPSTFVIVNLLPEHAADGSGSAIRLNGLPGHAHRMDTRFEDFGPFPRAGTFSSDQPVGVVGRHIYPGGAVTAHNAGQNGGDIIIPWVVHQPGGPSSSITIMSGGGFFLPGDPGAVPGDAVLELYAMGELEPLDALALNIPASTHRRFELDIAFPDTELPRDADGRFEGWMRVRSTFQVAVQTTIGATGSAGRYSVAGIPAEIAAPVQWAPLVRSASAGFTSDIMVFNSSGVPASIEVEYFGHGGSCADRRFEHAEGAVVVAPRDIAVLSQRADRSGLPAACEAAAVVSTDGAAVMAWVIDRDGAGHGAAYELFNRFEIGQRIALPLLYANDEGRATRIVVQNTDAAGGPREAVLRLWNLVGSEVDCDACTVTLGPGGSATFDVAALAGVPASFEGSGEVRADGGLLAIVVDMARDGAGDISMWRGTRAEIAAAGGASLPITISGAAPDPTPVPTPGPTPTPWTVTNTLHLPVVETNRPGAP